MKCIESDFAPIIRADPHEIYEELWLAFLRRHGMPAPFLWCVTKTNLIRLRSSERPDISRITTEILRNIETREVVYNTEIGSHWRFVMVCNPTKRDKPTKGKRRSLIDPDDVYSWMIRKGVQHGFALNRFFMINLGPVSWTSSSGNCAIHGSIEISGTIKIVDQSAFDLAMINGIGTAKSAGMGMMMLTERLG